jgi:hemerythrin-like metal-binding protein
MALFLLTGGLFGRKNKVATSYTGGVMSDLRVLLDAGIELGINEIDLQHKELLIALKDFIETAKNGASLEQLRRKFTRLNILIDNHLFSEEKLFKENNSYIYIKHLKEHYIIREKLMQFYNILQIGFITGFPEEILNSFIKFIEEHVKGMDLKTFKVKRSRKDKSPRVVH